MSETTIKYEAPSTSRSWFVLTLLQSTSGSLVVRAAEIIASNKRVRTSFTERPETIEIFDSTFEIQLMALVAEIPDSEYTATFKDGVVVMRNLSLSGIKILATDYVEGERQLLVKFSKFVGDINAVFSENAQFTDSFMLRSSETAMEIAENIVVRLSTLATTVDLLRKQGSVDSDLAMRQAIDEILESARATEFFNLLMLRKAKLNLSFADEKLASSSEPLLVPKGQRFHSAIEQKPRNPCIPTKLNFAHLLSHETHVPRQPYERQNFDEMDFARET